MLFQAACLELRTRRPALLAHVSGTKGITPELRTGPPGLDSSTPALRRILHNAASASGNCFSLDVFASSTDHICARYFSAVVEADSEGCVAAATHCLSLTGLSHIAPRATARDQSSYCFIHLSTLSKKQYNGLDRSRLRA